MLPWYKDYGKAIRLGMYAGALVGAETKYCLVDVGRDNKISGSELALVLILGLSAGSLLAETVRAIKDTYNMRKEEKMKKYDTESIQ